jgi:hypothetical protein
LRQELIEISMCYYEMTNTKQTDKQAKKKKKKKKKKKPKPQITNSNESYKSY